MDHSLRTSGGRNSYSGWSDTTSTFELSEQIRRNQGSFNSFQSTLNFYNADSTYQSLTVETNLRSDHVCDIIAMKNRLQPDEFWSIVEYWIDIGLERYVEDHEHITEVYQSMENYPQQTAKKLLFKKNIHKFDMFEQPLEYFPSDMTNLNGFSGIDSGDWSAEILENIVVNGEECPSMFGQVWIREPNFLWTKAYLLLKDGMLLISYKIQVMANFIRRWKHSMKDASLLLETLPSIRYKEDVDEVGQLHVFARLTDSVVYSALESKNRLRAPTEYAICIRNAAGATSEAARESRLNATAAALLATGRTAAPLTDASRDLRCIACETERVRQCWLAAMRLAKYGKQLRENYRNFKSKQQKDSVENDEDYARYATPNENIRSRVPMDFTGSVGRIVEDPEEAKEIAELEVENSYKQKLRPNVKEIKMHLSGPKLHINQPWFHGQLSREQSMMLVNRSGDGSFLVRESNSNPGIYVLTFKCGGKVIHSQIQPIVEPGQDTVRYTLDGGATKFYDMLQLVEFYQLNAGCLPTKLTHFVSFEDTNSVQTDEKDGVTNHKTDASDVSPRTRNGAVNRPKSIEPPIQNGPLNTVKNGSVNSIAQNGSTGSLVQSVSSVPTSRKSGRGGAIFGNTFISKRLK